MQEIKMHKKFSLGNMRALDPLERPSHICDGGIRIYLKELGCEGLAGFICLRMGSNVGEFLY